MKTENAITPLQAAMDALETARVTLIQKLNGEANQNKLELASLQLEVKALNTKRAELITKWGYKEAEKVAEKVPPLQAKIKECENKSVEFDKKLEDARQCRALELQPLVFKANHEMQNQQVHKLASAERAFINLVTDQMRDAVKAMATSNQDHARRTVLGTFDLLEN